MRKSNLLLLNTMDRKAYRHKLLNEIPDDVRHLVPIRHIEWVVHRSQDEREQVFQKLRSGIPLRVIIQEQKASKDSSETPLKSRSKSRRKADPAGSSWAASRAAVRDLMTEIFPEINALTAEAFLNEPPLDAIVRAYAAFSQALEQVAAVPHGVIVLLRIAQFFAERIYQDIDSNPSLQIVFSQSRLSAQNSQGEPVGKYIESAHVILDRIEGHRTEDRSARNLVFRLNDILTRKENLS